MGDTKKIRKKYQTPEHPWIKSRIESEKVFIKDYGLKNKQEVWKMDSKLKNFKDQIKKLAGRSDTQADIERSQLRSKLLRLGLIKEESTLSDVLGLDTTAILERRLQTILVRKGLARSMKQARQMITHRHVNVNDNRITTPSYLVSVDEQPSIEFVARSSFFSVDHPERISIEELEKIKARKEAMENKEGDEEKESVMTEEEIEAKKIKESLPDEEDVLETKDEENKEEVKTEEAPKEESTEEVKEEVKE